MCKPQVIKVYLSLCRRQQSCQNFASWWLYENDRTINILEFKLGNTVFNVVNREINCINVVCILRYCGEFIALFSYSGGRVQKKNFLTGEGLAFSSVQPRSTVKSFLYSPYVSERKGVIVQLSKVISSFSPFSSIKCTC